ncbi:hypothetical protein ANN_09458 [Periplaneta americana]|uniref:Uncharacterized protein n=1 Tax=Periplaneta americana TaxID=6978 RepID=A0ABQ8TNF3_PERAM|nr:hypothetical protein ANN_09458 [Periplaneta americana]
MELLCSTYKDHLQIYTDGSLNPNNGTSGAGYYIPKYQESYFLLYSSSSSLDTELLAIDALQLQGNCCCSLRLKCTTERGWCLVKVLNQKGQQWNRNRHPVKCCTWEIKYAMEAYIPECTCVCGRETRTYNTCELIDELKCAVYIQGKCLAKMSFNAEQVKIKNVNIRNLEKLVRFVLSLPGSHADREREMMFSLMNNGSKLDRNGNTGAGIDCNLFSFYLIIGPVQTNFDDELEAINTTLKQLPVTSEVKECHQGRERKTTACRIDFWFCTADCHCQDTHGVVSDQKHGAALFARRPLRVPAFRRNNWIARLSNMSTSTCQLEL